MERDPQALALIERLGMIPHPEGGWYVEMAREGVGVGNGEGQHSQRGTLSTIYFLLEQGQLSHWHRIDAVEVWLWHAGSALALGVAAEDAGPVEWVRLGADILNGEVLQKIIPYRFWQSAEAREGWVLVSCVVAPGFEFAGFELAPAGWAPRQ